VRPVSSTLRKVAVALGALVLAGCVALVVSLVIEVGSGPDLPGKPFDCVRADSQAQIEACRKAER
jgi:hypothetical protein